MRVKYKTTNVQFIFPAKNGEEKIIELSWQQIYQIEKAIELLGHLKSASSEGEFEVY